MPSKCVTLLLMLTADLYKRPLASAKKTAERVVVDLSDKVGLPTRYGQTETPLQTELNTSDEALEALMALGYTLADATKALENVDVNLPTSQRVTEALKK